MGSGGFSGRAVVVCALAVGLAASGCTAAPAPAPPPENIVEDLLPDAINVDTRGTAPAPAPPIEGARVGGTLFVLEAAAPEHLDPQQISTPDALTIGTVLFRHLTNYIEDPKGGRLQLVGDLATNTGETTDGGRTWTYHLRDNIAFQDGTAITSKDIAYGIARSFGTYGQHGPQLVQICWTRPAGTRAPTPATRRA